MRTSSQTAASQSGKTREMRLAEMRGNVHSTAFKLSKVIEAKLKSDEWQWVQSIGQCRVLFRVKNQFYSFLLCCDSYLIHLGRAWSGSSHYIALQPAKIWPSSSILARFWQYEWSTDYLAWMRPDVVACSSAIGALHEVATLDSIQWKFLVCRAQSDSLWVCSRPGKHRHRTEELRKKSITCTQNETNRHRWVSMSVKLSLYSLSLSKSWKAGPLRFPPRFGRRTKIT